jgi:hypothetical protein
MIKRFSENDKAFLKANYPQMTRKEIAQKLGFSVQQTSVWIKKLNIKQRADYGNHGLSGTPIYQIWEKIKGRCYNKNDRAYKYYGGRGIFVCNQWKYDFQEFYNWCIKNNWNKNLEIDRKENNGPYSPDNCRLVTHLENMNNRSNTVILTAFGETKPMSEWSRDSRCKVNYNTLSIRIKNGFNHEESITELPGKLL